jgi:hypothetical protein
MRAKYLRISKLAGSRDLVGFRGLYLMNGESVVNTVYTVSTTHSPVSGGLGNLLVTDLEDVLNHPIVKFNKTDTDTVDFKLVLTLDTEVDFTNIRVVCGDNYKEHPINFGLSYSTNGTVWKSFNRRLSPEYKENSVGEDSTPLLDLRTSTNSDYSRNERVFRPIPTVDNTYVLVLSSYDTYSTGKYFYEVSLDNSDRITGSNYGLISSMVSLDQVVETLGQYKRGYYTGSDTNGSTLANINNATSVMQWLTPGYRNNQVWPENTQGVFVDLDNSQVKMVYNGQSETSWHTFTRTGQEPLRLVTRLRNVGPGARLMYNYNHRYDYSVFGLDETYDTEFLYIKGWIKDYYIDILKPPNTYIDWPHTKVSRGLIKPPVYLAVEHHLAWIVEENNFTGEGYIKSTVHVDYPPKEPISRRVALYSISDNQIIKQTWSDPMTGQYEFVRIPMKTPYLIFTYDYDENYNADIVGPVYAELMPIFKE